MSQPIDDYEAGDVNVVDEAVEELDEGEYEPGDVNTVGSGPGNGAATDSADTSVAVLRYLARSLSNDPDAVVIQTEERRSGVRLRLHVAPSDMGRIIGRRGRTAQAIRALVGAAGARDGVQTTVDIVDD
jgi:uncharacterized protein